MKDTTYLLQLVERIPGRTTDANGRIVPGYGSARVFHKNGHTFEPSGKTATVYNISLIAVEADGALVLGFHTSESFNDDGGIVLHS